MKENSFYAAAVVPIAILIFVMGFVVLAPFTYVPVGHRGIETRLGAPTGHVRGEGFHLMAPIVSGNHNFEVRIKKIDTTASAASRDLQDVTSVISLNYSVDPSRVVDVYQNIGDDYESRIIQPAIQDIVKAATAKFNAEELITKREDVSRQILSSMRDRVEQHGIHIVEFNIVDFDFSESFTESIERKVTAQQDALAAENRLKQIEFESQQAVETARGKSEAQRIEGEALRANPEVIQLRAIEQWDGVLPTYVTGGQAVPFINIK